MLPAVVPDVLDADQAGLGASKLSPLANARERVPAAVDAPEVVVRREEHEVPAQIAEALDDVVLAGGDVLVVARKDDQVVGPRKRVTAPRLLEIELGQIVDLEPLHLEPAEERQVVVAEVRRNATVEEGPRQVDRLDLGVFVPRVSLVVADRVAPVEEIQVFVGMTTATGAHRASEA